MGNDILSTYLIQSVVNTKTGKVHSKCATEANAKKTD
jgi:hypothetical protein